MTADELKQTDVYSLGLLVWRVFVDGDHLFQTSRTCSSESAEDDASFSMHTLSDVEIRTLKHSGGLLQLAQQFISGLQMLKDHEKELINYVFLKTIQLDPAERSLQHATAALEVERSVLLRHIH
jgi:hypothetical protein